MNLQLLAQSVAIDSALGGYRKDTAYTEMSNWRVYLFNFDYNKYKQYFARYELGDKPPEIQVTEADVAQAEKIVETLTSKMLFKEIAGTLSDFERSIYALLQGAEVSRKSHFSMVLMMPKLFQDYIEQEKLESRVYGRTQLVKDRKIEGTVVISHKRSNKDYGYDTAYGVLDDEYPVMFYIGHDKPWTVKLETPTKIRGRVADVRYLNGTAYTRLNYIKILDK